MTYDPTCEYLLTYKIECPIAHGGRIDLHWGWATKGHVCDLNYYVNVGEDEKLIEGFTGLLPFFVEDGVLAIGKKILVSKLQRSSESFCIFYLTH